MPPSVTGRRAREPVRTGLAGILTIGLVAGAAAAGPGAVELLSRGDPQSDTAGADGSRPAVSADGRYVAFSSPATNLVAGQVDVGGTSDVFLHDRVAGTTILVSRTAASPVTAGNGDSFLPAVSADGRFVAYLSSATDLVAGQAASPVTFNVLLYDRETQATTLVSHAGASPTTPGDGDCQAVVLSADGRFVAFESRATNLVTGQVDVNDESDVFLHDREAGTTILVSRAAGSVSFW